MNESTITLKLLPSLADELARVAEAEGVSMDQYINLAVAEKLAAQRNVEFFAERIGRSQPGDMLAILEMAGTDKPEPDCEDSIERH
jgi:hypothetical protein